MNSHRFPSSAMLLPEFRKDLLLRKQRYQVPIKPLLDEQQLREFQHLVQHSLQNGIVLQIVTISDQQKLCTTGIIIKAEPWSGKLVLSTIEGERVLYSSHITEITEF
jgi:hypothetical protein